MATAASSSNGKKYGGIPGIPPGTTFPNRKALRASGVHAEVRAGIFAEKYRDGAYAVLLNGGYADQDHGETIEYVGQGGLDKPGGTQVASQKWDWRNKSLQQSYESRKPVRVVRGSKLNSPYAPEQGRVHLHTPSANDPLTSVFRYDGLYSVTKVFGRRNPQNLLECVARMQRLPDQSPLPPPRSPTKTSAHAHAVAGGSGQPAASARARGSSSSRARAEVGDLSGSFRKTHEGEGGASIEDEAESSGKTDGEEDDPRADDASDSSGMSIEEDEYARHPHNVTSGSRIRPMPLSHDEEAEEELEVLEILETPVDEGEESGSSAEKDDVEGSEEDDGHEGSVVDALSQAASVRDLCAAILEAAAASELASRATRMPRDASEADETSTPTGATEEPTGGANEPAGEVDEPAGEIYDPQSPSSPHAVGNDIISAMAELKDSTALFDAAMRRLRDAERATSHPHASSLATPSTRSTTESDFEDTLGDAAAAAASAADLASLAIRRRA